MLFFPPTLILCSYFCSEDWNTENEVRVGNDHENKNGKTRPHYIHLTWSRLTNGVPDRQLKRLNLLDLMCFIEPYSTPPAWEPRSESGVRRGTGCGGGVIILLALPLRVEYPITPTYRSVLASNFYAKLSDTITRHIRNASVPLEYSTYSKVDM